MRWNKAKQVFEQFPQIRQIIAEIVVAQDDSISQRSEVSLVREWVIESVGHMAVRTFDPDVLDLCYTSMNLDYEFLGERHYVDHRREIHILFRLLGADEPEQRFTMEDPGQTAAAMVELVLDQYRSPVIQAIVVRTVQNAIGTVDSFLIYRVDHDLDLRRLIQNRVPSAKT